jgi:hypothetical protein
MMKWIIDPVRGPVLVPEWMAEMVMCEQRNGGFVHASDRAAYNRVHSSLPPSANVRVVGAAPTVTPGEPSTGLVEPASLKSPPGTELVDRLVDAQDRRDRVEAAFRRRLKR